MLLFVALFALVLGLSPPLTALADSSLVFHMLGQHTLLLGAGLLAARFARRGGLLESGGTRGGRLGVPITGGLAVAVAIGSGLFVIVGHASPAFARVDASSGASAAVGHLAYVAAGFGLGAALPALDPLARALVVIWGEASMGLLVLVMLAGAVTYVGYSPTEVATAGLAMLVGMQALWLAVPLARWFARQRRA